MTGALRIKTVQVHVSRRCNLACAHCYSRSGPREREALPVAALISLLGQAQAEGYQCLAVSGGEPLLYPRLGQVLDHAAALGLARIGVTNGTLHRATDLALLGAFDLVAVSIDGPEAVHDALRGSPTAFARSVRGLRAMREAGISFGIAHTVTRDSLPHLRWMADFAVAEGAEVLQLHPLGAVGAASERFAPLDGEVCARTYLAAKVIAAKYAGRLRVHVDLFNLEDLRRAPERVVPPNPDDVPQARLADLINPLVVMADGTLSPICHAMGPQHRIGRIGELPLKAHGRHFRRNRYPAFRRFCADLLDEVLADEDGWPYLNWYELLQTRSQRPSLSERAA